MYDMLTVLIPTRNRPDDLRQSLEHAKDCGLNELRHIIYDDASDNVAATIAAAEVVPNSMVLRGQTRIGQAGGRNILLKECKTPYALLMEDDTWFTDARSLADVLNKDLYYEGIGTASVVCSQIFRTYDGMVWFPAELKTCRVLNPVGAGCIVKVKDIINVGAFRSYWRYRHEETELGLRLWKNNLPVVYDASLVVEHCHTPAARSSHEYQRNSARNLILMHTLNLPGVFGFPLGFLRSLRLLLVKEYKWSAIIAGVFEGVCDSLRHRDDILPMQKNRYIELRAFQQALKKHMEMS
jgi:GT2 family glycosyltransferase